MSFSQEDWRQLLISFDPDADAVQGFESQLMSLAQEHLEASLRPSISNTQKIEQNLYFSQMPEAQGFDNYIQALGPIVKGTVNTERPDFIGHMTSALPSYMPVLAKLMTRLNQNNVKLETSGSFTDLERQVLSILHRLFYGSSHVDPDSFYQKFCHSPTSALGVFCSGGTVANTLALWVARNRFLQAYDVAEDGMLSAMMSSGYAGFAVLVSERGHYSLAKAADLLGLGRKQLICIATDADHRMDMEALDNKLLELRAANIKVIALVGVAGATETGSIDPLVDMAAVAARLDCHFHVDSAWGGAAIFSEQHRSRLAGIELADSITLDAHKQLYIPMGAGIVLFKDPTTVNYVKHHASYIIRSDSKDLGAFTLEGSRPAMSMLLHAGMHLIGGRGYGMLVDHSIDLAQAMAEMIKQAPDFELLLEPQLNILAYRFLPPFAQCSARLGGDENRRLNDLTVAIQVRQAELGGSFVSRTQLTLPQYGEQKIHVFRVVLANPNTNVEILRGVLDQQREIAAQLLG